MNQTKLIPVSRWSDYHPWPSVPALRQLIFYAKHNGLEPCIQRVGRRVLINEQAFFEWMTNQPSVSLRPKAKGN